MANDTPRIIQKDLGIVTAYGYALVGGYEGTEQQFIEDFAKLMQGRMHNDYTFATIAEMNAAIQAGQIEDGATIFCKEEKGTINNEVRQEDISDLFTAYDDCCSFVVTATDCGNNTFISLWLRFNKDVTINHKSAYTLISALDLDYETYSYLAPVNIADPSGIYLRYTDIIGFPYDPYYGESEKTRDIKRNPNAKPYADFSYNSYNNDAISIRYRISNMSSDDISIEKQTVLNIDHFIAINRRSVPSPSHDNGG